MRLGRRVRSRRNLMCQNNAFTIILTLARKYNETITFPTNTYSVKLTDSLVRFIDHALKINLVEKRPWCFEDFNLKPNNFRQKLSVLKNIIEKVVSGHPSFYKINGTDLPGVVHSITLRPMGDTSEQFKEYLNELKDQPPMIHDIRLRIDTQEIYDELSSKGLTPNKNNNSILFSIPSSFDPAYNLKLLSYPKHTQLIVGCTFRPIIHDVPGILNLIFLLGRVTELLVNFISEPISIPPVSDWIITQYHFNKDGKEEVSGQDFHFTFGSVSGELIRMYSKEFSNGSKIVRSEKIMTPRITLQQELENVLKSSHGHA